jgi:hypothetical protein
LETSVAEGVWSRHAQKTTGVCDAGQGRGGLLSAVVRKAAASSSAMRFNFLVLDCSNGKERASDIGSTSNR